MIKKFKIFERRDVKSAEGISVGDYVICIDNRLAQGKFRLNKIYTITDIYIDGGEYFCAVDGNYGWFLNRFKKISKEEAEKIKKEEIENIEKHKELDPYGEENWMEESIKWYNKGKWEEADSEDINNVKYYDDFITDDEFRQFLIDNGCYETFIKHCKDKFKKDFSLATKAAKGRSIIDLCLIWRNIPGGSQYWSDLNNKWNRKIDDEN